MKSGDNIVWGMTCGNSCDNVAWGVTSGANIVWGMRKVGDNIVWGMSKTSNIVWGMDCNGGDCGNVIWGSAKDDNLVWGTAKRGDNIVWGMGKSGNIVWGMTSDVWASSAGDEPDVVYPDSAAADGVPETSSPQARRDEFGWTTRWSIANGGL